MKWLIPMLFTLCAVTSWSSAFAQDQPTPNQKITILVAVIDHEGHPVPRLAVSARLDGNTHETALPVRVATDEDGSAKVEFEASTGLTAVVATLGPDLDAKNPRAALEANKWYAELKRRSSFQREYRVPLAPGQHEYRLVLRGRPAVSVSGRLVSPDGALLSGNVWDRQSWAMTGVRAPREGPFALDGLACGAPAEIMCLHDGCFVARIALSAEQTAKDVNLGDVVLQPVSGECTLRVRIQPRSGALIAIVDSTTGQMFMAVANREGFVVTRLKDDTGVLSVPAGEYYVLPVATTPSDDIYRVLDWIRDGRAKAMLDIQTVVASPGRQTECTVDLADVHAKLTAAMNAERGPASR